jgi:2-polyprenyl-3-methyl-5-hydroxy-6-metoxy-1,4-benzoquinol methylase
MTNATVTPVYEWTIGGSTRSHAYLLPAVLRTLARGTVMGLGQRVFDLGCGNGALAEALHQAGYEVSGVDPSPSGIERANQARPYLDLRPGSDADDLAATFGQFPFVVCMEVVEHVYDPHRLARRIYDLLESGGLAVISTPYHGYLKNLALSAVPGAWDRHWHPLIAGGHIKFWSEATLTKLLRDVGMRAAAIERVGRWLPALAKSMVVTARKEADAEASN